MVDSKIQKEWKKYQPTYPIDKNRIVSLIFHLFLDISSYETQSDTSISICAVGESQNNIVMDLILHDEF